MSGNFKPPPKQSSIKLDSFIYDSPSVGLMKALQHYHIHHQKIVYAQAILETGYFTSDVYKRHNNLFGLYNSKSHSYYHFNNWYESVDAYGRYIQYRYNGKGYYNDIFAPGWTVASLWELFTPGRAEIFMER